MSTDLGSLFDDTDLNVGIDLFESTCSGETRRACTDDDNVIIHIFSFQGKSPRYYLNFKYVFYKHHICISIVYINNQN